MCTDIRGVGEADERDQGCRLGGVEDGKEGGSGVVRLVDGEIRVFVEPFALCLRSECISLQRMVGFYNRPWPDTGSLVYEQRQKAYSTA